MDLSTVAKLLVAMVLGIVTYRTATYIKSQYDTVTTVLSETLSTVSYYAIYWPIFDVQACLGRCFGLPRFAESAAYATNSTLRLDWNASSWHVNVTETCGSLAENASWMACPSASRASIYEYAYTRWYDIEYHVCRAVFIVFIAVWVIKSTLGLVVVEICALIYHFMLQWVGTKSPVPADAPKLSVITVALFTGAKSIFWLIKVILGFFIYVAFTLLDVFVAILRKFTGSEIPRIPTTELMLTLEAWVQDASDLAARVIDDIYTDTQTGGGRTLSWEQFCKSVKHQCFLRNAQMKDEDFEAMPSESRADAILRFLKVDTEAGRSRYYGAFGLNNNKAFAYITAYVELPSIWTWITNGGNDIVVIRDASDKKKSFVMLKRDLCILHICNFEDKAGGGILGESISKPSYEWRVHEDTRRQRSNARTLTLSREEAASRNLEAGAVVTIVIAADQEEPSAATPTALPTASPTAPLTAPPTAPPAAAPASTSVAPTTTPEQKAALQPNARHGASGKKPATATSGASPPASVQVGGAPRPDERYSNSSGGGLDAEASSGEEAVSELAQRQEDATSSCSESSEVEPLYRQDECWAAAIVVLIAAACRWLHKKKRLRANMTEMALRFTSAKFVRSAGATTLVQEFAAKYALRPNNAIRALVEILNHFELTTDKRVCYDFCATGPYQPKTTAFGCLKLHHIEDSSVGHWVAVVPRDGKFVTIDSQDPQQRVSDTPPAPVNTYWLWPREVPECDEPECDEAGVDQRAQLGAGAKEKAHKSATFRAVPARPGRRTNNRQPPAVNVKKKCFAGQGTETAAITVLARRTAAEKPAATVLATPLSRSTTTSKPVAPTKTSASKPKSASAKESTPAPPKAAEPAPAAFKAAASAAKKATPAPPKVASSVEKELPVQQTPPVQAPVLQTAKKTIFDAAGSGRHRKNTSSVFVKALCQAGVCNESSRDCAIASAVMMLRAIVQVSVQIARLQDLTTRDPADYLDESARCALLALTRSGTEVVDAIRNRLETKRAGAGWISSVEGRLRTFLEPADVLPELLQGAVQMGLLTDDQLRSLLTKHEVPPCLPLSEPVRDDPEYLLVQPSHEFWRPSKARNQVELGPGVRGVMEAAVFINDRRAANVEGAATEHSRHFTFVGQQRADSEATEGRGDAANSDAFVVINDDNVSRTVGWEDALQGIPAYVPKQTSPALSSTAPAAAPSVPSTPSAPSTPVAVLMLFRITRVAAPLAPRVVQRGDRTAAEVRATEMPIADQVLARMTVPEMVQHFQLDSSNPFPLAVTLKGRDMKLIKLHGRPSHASNAWKGKSRRVREGHLRTLKALQRLPEELDELPLGEALVHYFARTAACPAPGKPAWQASTLHRNMCAAHGALGDLPIYSNVPVPIHLRESASWNGAIRWTEQRMQSSTPQNLPAINYEQICEAVKRCQDEEVATAIMLTWMMAGRVGDVTQMKASEIFFLPSSTESTIQRLQFSVRRGKGVALSHPYSVNTLCPPAWQARLMSYLARFAPDQQIFNRSTPREETLLSQAITAALRAVDPNHSQRALRRGALQTLAADPKSTLATLRTFSGHTNDETLLRYLNWGKEATSMQVAGFEAARMLLGEKPRATTSSSSRGSSAGSSTRTTSSSSSSSSRTNTL